MVIAEDELFQCFSSEDEEEPAVCITTTNKKGTKKKRRKKKVKRNLLRDIRPINERAACEAFLRNPTVNPVFIYASRARCKKAVSAPVCTALMKEAQLVLKRVLDVFDTEEELLTATEGPVLDSEAQVLHIVDEWLKRHELSEQITVEFNPSMLAAASMKGDGILQM